MSFVDARGLEGRQGAPFALSVLGAALVTALGTFILLVSDSEPLGALFAAFIAFLIAVFAIGLAAGIIGLPLTLLLARNGMERPWSYPRAGFVAGAALVTFTPVLTGDMRGDSVLEFLPFAWVGALPGGVCGTIWWLAYRRHMQDFGDQRG